MDTGRAGARGRGRGSGRAPPISVTSLFRVNDGLQHTAHVTFGVGMIQLQVDDDILHTRRDAGQPGLPQVGKDHNLVHSLSSSILQDANVFLGGEPGSKLTVGGFQVIYLVPCSVLDMSSSPGLHLQPGHHHCHQHRGQA